MYSLSEEKKCTNFASDIIFTCTDRDRKMKQIINKTAKKCSKHFFRRFKALYASIRA